MMHVSHNIEACLCNHCSSGKEISIIHSECMSVASVILHAKDMGCIILSSVASLSLPYFPTLSHTWNNFQEKSCWTQNACFDFLYNFCL